MPFFFWNLVLCAVAPALAYAEGRFNHKQLGAKSIPYINHAGMYCDIVLMTIIGYLIWPYAKDWQMKNVVTIGAVSAAISLGAHYLWSTLQPIPGHFIEPGGGRQPLGYWYHLFYMTVVMTVILMFYLHSPGAERGWVSIWLTIFIWPAVMWPDYYVSKMANGVGEVSGVSWFIVFLACAVIWLVGYYRLSGLLEP